MQGYGPLRCGLFIYDSLRVIVIAGALWASALSGTVDGTLPVLVYAAPNALFPLMALFLWIDPATWRPCLPLYLAGKAVTVAAMTAWLLFFGRSVALDLMSMVMTRNFAALVAPASTVLLFFTDGISILGVLTLMRGAAARGGALPGPETEGAGNGGGGGL